MHCIWVFKIQPCNIVHIYFALFNLCIVSAASAFAFAYGIQYENEVVAAAAAAARKDCIFGERAYSIMCEQCMCVNQR